MNATYTKTSGTHKWSSNEWRCRVVSNLLSLVSYETCFMFMLFKYIFQQMGIPIRKFICASNNNNVLTEFFNTGRYNMAGRRLVPTMSPAIDILKSSNLERYLFDILSRNPDKLNHLYEQLACDGTFQLPPLVRKLFIILYTKIINQLNSSVLFLYHINFSLVSIHSSLLFWNVNKLIFI